MFTGDVTIWVTAKSNWKQNKLPKDKIDLALEKMKVWAQNITCK